MDSLSFTIKYTSNYYSEKKLPEGQFMPQSYAMYWCMVATGASRIFSHNEMKEFLFRLAITLDTLKIVDNWFAYDKLFKFTYNNIPHSFNITDIFNHFGFEAVDGYYNQTNSADYFASIEKGLFNSLLTTSLIDSFKVIEVEFNDDNIFNTSLKEYVPQITPELINKAEYFANDILKLAPKNLFTETNEAFKAKLDELEERRKKVETLPIFKLEMLTDETIEKCKAIMLVPEYIAKLKETPEAYKKEAKRLLYLAWLFANDLLWGDDYETHEAEGVKLNYKDYSDEDGGFNLFQFYEEYNMQEMEMYLKGVGFK